MPYTLNTLPDHIQRNLNEAEQQLWLDAFNASYDETADDTASMQAAWGAVRKAAMLASIKSTTDGKYIVPGWGMLFTDEETKDLDEEFFDDLTRTFLEYYKNAPLWYEHGQDPVYGVEPIGMRKLVKVYPRGIYTEHELHPDHPQLQRTLDEIERGELTLSSDSLPQYWLQDRAGRNVAWPIAGWSLTKTPAEPALGAVSLKSFIKTLNRDSTGQSDTKAREAQGGSGVPDNRIVQISKGKSIMNEEMLAQLAAFLGLDSADPATLSTRLRELAASLEGATEVADEEVQAIEAKAEGDVSEEEEQTLETAKLVVTIKTALGLGAKASYADVADELRVIAKAVKSFNAQPQLDGNALNSFGAAWKTARNTPEPDMPFASRDDNGGGDGGNRGGGNSNRGGSDNGKRRAPAKSRNYGHFGIQNNNQDSVGIGRVLQEFYAYQMNRTPMKSQSYQLGSTGGLLLRHEISNDFIEMLRDKLILEQLGADFIPMDGMETLTLPKNSTETEAYWVGEGTDIPESEETVGGVTLYPKPLAARIIVPTKFLANSRVNYEAKIEEQAQYRINRKLLYAALFGAGGKTGSNTGVEPAGLATIADMTGRGVTKT
jgi:HK97 family phage major capsid protein